ncbi:MAG TPA: membrane protein insertase YidC, partial [Methylotenera sp.]|nr:membrane protein insertase YidC [Methylotenera sp.]
MDTKRLILFIIFSMSILMLWDAWQRQNLPEPVAQQAGKTSDNSVAVPNPKTENTTVAESDFQLAQGQRISITTDLYQADIETTGGDLRKLTLLKHRASDGEHANFVLLDDAAKPMTYVAQTGLVGADLPTHKAVFTSTATSY